MPQSRFEFDSHFGDMNDPGSSPYANMQPCIRYLQALGRSPAYRQYLKFRDVALGSLSFDGGADVDNLRQGIKPSYLHVAENLGTNLRSMAELSELAAQVLPPALRGIWKFDGTPSQEGSLAPIDLQGETHGVSEEGVDGERLSSIWHGLQIPLLTWRRQAQDFEALTTGITTRIAGDLFLRQVVSNMGHSFTVGEGTFPQTSHFPYQSPEAGTPPQTAVTMDPVSQRRFEQSVKATCGKYAQLIRAAVNACALSAPSGLSSDVSSKSPSQSGRSASSI
jgi:hypothetical protein